MKASIVGYGFVGKSLHELFGDQVSIYDPNINEFANNQYLVNDSDIAFVAVPTPVDENGECDTSIVEESVQWIESDIIVIRSTIAPGTTDKIASETGKTVVFQPEYVGETVAHPLLDHQMQNFAIFGGDRAACQQVADFYKQFFHSEIKFYFTSAVAAEICKYMENSFFATKVTFCNEFYIIAETFGVSYDELRELWLADPRINRDHTFVYPENRGFSGKCLPKDVSAIIAAAEKAGASPDLMKSVMRINRSYRKDDPTYGPYKDVPKD